MSTATTGSAAFGGRIGRTLADSEPWFEEPPHPGEAAPNVVVVLLDDTGFAQLGCYGSPIDTPHIDALAAGGLQFTNFHVTPLCSPTRASLLTGRSQHAVGMRTVANFRTGFPHQLGHISAHAATVAEVLRDARLRDVVRRQVAPRPDGAVLGGRSVRPLATGARVRPVLRLPRGRDRPVPSRPGVRQPSDRSAGSARGRLPPQRGPRRPTAADDRRQPRRAPGSPVPRLPPVRCHPRAAPGAGRAPAEVPRRLRRRVGRRAPADPRASTGPRRDPRGHRPGAAQRRCRRVGCPARDAAAAGVSSAGGLRRVPRPHRRADRPSRRRPAPDWASWTTPCWS